MGQTINIFLFAAVFAVFSFYINKKFGKRDRLKQLQKETNEYQKQLREATLKKDDAELKRLQAREQEVMEKTKEMLFLPFRSMIIILPAFFVAYWLLAYFFPNYVSPVLPVYLPHFYTIWDPAQWRNQFGSRGIFIYSLMLLGIVIEIIWNTRERIKKARAEAEKKNEEKKSGAGEAGKNA
jgi:uncharacterized membrane protein (DUF106 family)